MDEHIKRADALAVLSGIKQQVGVGKDIALTMMTEATMGAAIQKMQSLPSADVVSKAAYEQCLWERDLAIHQLRKDYGVGLGQVKGDVSAAEKWVSVKDMLPGDMSNVLVVAFWHERWQVMEGYCLDIGLWYVFTSNGEVSPGGVTHWMPLPEPPKEEPADGFE